VASEHEGDADDVQGYFDCDILIKLGLTRQTVAHLLLGDRRRLPAFDEGVAQRLGEDDDDPHKPYVPPPPVEG